jgi:hypothetical protein
MTPRSYGVAARIEQHIPGHIVWGMNSMNLMNFMADRLEDAEFGPKCAPSSRILPFEDGSG